MPRDVADDEPDLTVGEVDEVVEVAADLPRGAVERRDLPPGEVGDLPWEELLLDEVREAELLFETLSRSDLRFLLADQLRDTERGRGLRRQLVRSRRSSTEYS